MKKKDFAIYTLGCKLNFSESSDITRRLTEAGCILSEKPDFIIVNTCAVTGSAEKKARNFVSKLHRENPEAQLIITGCYSALQSEIVKQWEGVSRVFGNRDKLNIINYIKGETSPPSPPFFSSYSSHDRTRSFLKIQDGCDYHCTYCTVCIARGESRSDSIDNVLKNIEKIHQAGLKEVNLTGVNIGDFGKGREDHLYDLLLAIEKQHLMERVRISSIEPNLLRDEIIDLVAQSEIMMPHFHIPLQSGCDKILALMKRRYNRQLFAEKVSKIKNKIPDACIAIDVITGFPGESDEDFKDTYAFLTSLPLSYLHVFTYSKRPNTLAAMMQNHLPVIVKKERTNHLLALSHEKKKKFYLEHCEQERMVLIESTEENGCLFGFTDNYIKVKAPYKKELINTIINLKIEENNLCMD